MSTGELAHLAIVFACLAMGGVLKGATGAGAPILAVPALAMIFDVRFAVVVMLMPNLLTNMWQGWRFRASQPQRGFVWSLAVAGGLGVVAGTLVLVTFSAHALSLLVAFAVLAYVALRFARPGWHLDFALAKRLSIPAGLVAGMLQGATGLSAPVSLTFLNAMRLERLAFIATVSVFFAVMTVPQIAALGYMGLLSARTLLLSFAAMLPILAFMPVGAALARRLSRESFDRAILLLLTLLSLKLAWDALATA